MNRIAIISQREVLTAARTYYVATNGSDTNNGLSSGTPFLTIQKAVNAAASVDGSIYNITIQLADGTYAETVTLKSFVGAGTITIQGNATTPANVLVSSSGSAFYADNVIGFYKIKNLKVASSGSVKTGFEMYRSYLFFDNIDFGAFSSGYQIMSANSAFVQADGNYTISGGSALHLRVIDSGVFRAYQKTVTLTGTPAFSIAFALAARLGNISYSESTFSGSATGVRYIANMNSVINTNGGATYLPGDSAGSTVTGGQYT